MRWRLTLAGERKRVWLLASRHDHCLLDLLWRWRSGQLDCEIAGVIDNHPDLDRSVSTFRVPYHHVPVTTGTKPDAEERMLGLIGSATWWCGAHMRC